MCQGSLGEWIRGRARDAVFPAGFRVIPTLLVRVPHYKWQGRVGSALFTPERTELVVSKPNHAKAPSATGPFHGCSLALPGTGETRG